MGVLNILVKIHIFDHFNQMKKKIILTSGVKVLQNHFFSPFLRPTGKSQCIYACEKSKPRNPVSKKCFGQEQLSFDILFAERLSCSKKILPHLLRSSHSSPAPYKYISLHNLTMGIRLKLGREFSTKNIFSTQPLYADLKY